MDNNIRINQYDSMSSTGPETLSPGSPDFSHASSHVRCWGHWRSPPATANHSPAYVDNSPATGLDIANSQIAPSPDALAADVVTQDPIVAAYNHYTADQLAVIESIAMEASSMFCVGATFTSSGELRDSVRKFAHKKGFSVTSIPGFLDGSIPSVPGVAAGVTGRPE
ncbi:hypothetical protein IV203_012177 [Nitzschia inconspicua]|uniref:Uncharacterized protein n=1 Tax=Nitzschia inconspicua TaxID=303405 RepID=A0A9K3KTF7_9STRA|nr:hypothetical protein IV203_012177 [Nitzschia inconspicua]